ncbi:MAG: DUF721 domain-containing protein [Acidobacteriota bacterium]
MPRTLQRAGSLLGKLKLPPGSDSPEQRAQAAWKLAAGDKIGKRTTAGALVRGTLVIEVSDMVWQRQLATLRHFLLRNLATVLGEALVKDIDFRPMPRRKEPQRAVVAGSAVPSKRLDEALGIGDPVMAMLYRQSRLRFEDSDIGVAEKKRA